MATPATVTIDGNNPNQQSEYEQLRARNIVRNNARLRSLGLITRREEERSNALALGKPVNDGPAGRKEESNGEWTHSHKKKKRKSNIVEASRKSLRLQGITPELEILGPRHVCASTRRRNAKNESESVARFVCEQQKQSPRLGLTKLPKRTLLPRTSTVSCESRACPTRHSRIVSRQLKEQRASTV